MAEAAGKMLATQELAHFFRMFIVSATFVYL